MPHRPPVHTDFDAPERTVRIAADRGRSGFPDRARRTSLAVPVACVMSLAMSAVTVFARGHTAGRTTATPAVIAGIALVPLAAAAVVDVWERRLPDRLVLLAAVPVVAPAMAAPLPGMPAGTASHLGAAAMGAVVLGGPLLAVHLVDPACMGFGDVKAAAVLGAAIGPVLDVRGVLGVLCVACGVAGAWGVVRRRRAVPLGPALVVGAHLVLLAASASTGGLTS